MDVTRGRRASSKGGLGTARSVLRRIRSLVDVSLRHLDVDDMLAELLHRVRNILEVDTAVILAYDNGSHSLVARAASGLEEEIYQNVRVPVGQGFAGRIAATKRPVVLRKIDETTVTNPILWEKGIRSMLGVPLLIDDTLYGVLHVGSLTSRRFTQEDVALLSLVGQQVVLATQSSELNAERAAAKVLERSLAPSGLPAVPGLEFAARYATAADERGVGGDWYDVFELPTKDVWLVVGDVAGKGLSAAVVMGRLRTTIRALAFQGASPDEALRMTDSMLQFFDPEHSATALCVVIPPSSEELLVCSAGHPPPIVKLPDRTGRPLDLTAGPLLGAAPEAPRSTVAVRFPAGALVLLYSDGLIERRGETLDLGLERLSRLVTSEHPDLVCRRIMFRLIGGSPPQDDVVMLAVRRTGEETPRRTGRRPRAR